jgi:hypothetical protein
MHRPIELWNKTLHCMNLFSSQEQWNILHGIFQTTDFLFRTILFIVRPIQNITCNISNYYRGTVPKYYMYEQWISIVRTIQNITRKE